MEDTTKRIGIGAAIGLGVGVVLGAPALGVVALGAIGAGGGKAYDVYKGLPGTGGGGGGSGGGYVPPKDEPTGRPYVAPKVPIDPTRPAGDMAGTRGKGAPVLTIAKDFFKSKFGGTPGQWPEGTPCGADMAKLEDGERAAADGSAIPSYKETVYAAALGADTAEMRRVADLLRKRAATLSDAVTTKYAYLPSAKCLDDHANDLDGIVAPEHRDLGS